MIIEYSDDLSTGNQLIDHQHKELIDRIRNLVTSCEEGNGQRKAITMLEYLSEYTDFHFKSEEDLMKHTNYPEIEVHMKKHAEFRKSVDELFDFLTEAEGPNNEFVEQVQKNVVDWLFHHIQTFDRSVAENIAMVDNADRL